DSQLERWILRHVRSDLGDRAHPGRLDIRTIAVKRDFPIWSPAIDHPNLALGPCRSRLALRAYFTRRACWTSATGHRVSLRSPLSSDTLRTQLAGRTCGTNGTNQCRAISARLSG